MNRKFLTTLLLVGTRLGASILQFVLALLIARLYGAAILGEFQIYISYTLLFGSFFSIGLPSFVAREVAANDVSGGASQQNSSVIGWLFVIITVLCLSVYAIYAFAKEMPLVSSYAIDNIVVTISIVSGGIYSILIVLSESLKGLKEVSRALISEFYYPPIFFLLILLLLTYSGVEITVGTLLVSYLSALMLALLFTSILIFTKHQLKVTRQTVSDNIGEVMRMWGIRLLNSLYPAAPYLVLPFFVSAVDVGLFSIAHKLVSVIGTIVTAVSSIYMADFSRSYYGGDKGKLMSEFAGSRKVLLTFVTPLAIIYMLLPGYLLSFFGDEFLRAATMLAVMAFSRYVASFFGLTETVLNMTGNAIYELRSAVISVGLFFLVAVLLVQSMGVLGAAIAFASSVVMRAVVSRYYVKMIHC